MEVATEVEEAAGATGVEGVMVAAVEVIGVVVAEATEVKLKLR